ncbi:hypothetical protein I3760_06G056600 [Carya illinoinensis]|uniref:Uncharacterized protein n=1 Tax=Carya illinoinensis TaxID=32201 RepID=A0A922JKQ7_CARIL|nr:uncharacterized protein LOC122314494 isoform X1 [Carya illinoinensis]KAG2701689.1 hypothetical protein I3760_06G056600 [Carya illinoinensis]KAG2701690.1 hypothetical protein I3760_06G056600 [Carya illinoinensis]KAG2701691.1 hypothetical protein I3760_06G056600 [Carya illinoinensis]KAG2701692.1 hypothetical protein I3760_06G056600 [Carya illinoinensis]KAG6707949.1 hypothetical protein I3842_06G056600 [Carya illinoinensis]
MLSQSPSASLDRLQLQQLLLCPCSRLRRFNPITIPFSKRKRRNLCGKWSIFSCSIPLEAPNRGLNVELAHAARRSAKIFVLNRFSHELYDEELPKKSPIQLMSNYTEFQNDLILDKLRTQMEVMRPIPSPPVSRNIVGLFVVFFFVGVAFDKLWTSRNVNQANGAKSRRGGTGSRAWPQVPTSFSLLLEKDLQRKESVEWVNMVLGKLWKVYRGGIENWIIGLLQPVIDDLKKPDYVDRVEIRQFSLGDEPLSVRNVERRTSRLVDDLQYQIGLRYAGDARMLLMLSLKFGIIRITVPVGVQDFDIDGELWVRLRLIPTEPWVGAVSWAFVSLPRIKFELSAFRLFNLMAIPVLSMFLTKLLTKDLPRLFVRPKKIDLDFQKGRSIGPATNDYKYGKMQEGNNNFIGELSVTLVDARNLSYAFYGKTDPYVILSLGDQTICSKKNSQTTVIGPPGEPIWNQDFHMLVVNPRKQKLYIQVKDSLGFAELTIGEGEVNLGSLHDTVPTDRIVVLHGGWGPFRKGSSGEILLRLTYKAYVEDEDDNRNEAHSTYVGISDDGLFDSDLSNHTDKKGQSGTDKESFMDVLATLIMSEEFQGIVASETGNPKLLDDLSTIGSMLPRSCGLNAESIPFNCTGVPKGYRGSALFWLAAITCVSVLLAIRTGGPGFFNP